MDIDRAKRIHSPAYGFGLVPKSTIKPGSVIIRISSPTLILVEQASLALTCSYCFLTPSVSPSSATKTLKRCVACKITHYCSTECQQADWALIHSKECRILKKLPACPPTPVRALMQMLLQHKFADGADPAWVDLKGHVEDFKKEGGKRWDDFMLQARGAMAFTKKDKTWKEMAVGLLCRMATNAFRVTLPDDTPVGLCFCPRLALVNHSCSPNAAISFDGRAISLRSITEINAGDQIFISYIDSMQVRGARRRELRERYFFTCECDVCTNNETPYQTFLRSRLSQLSEGVRQISEKSSIWWDAEAHDTFAKQFVESAKTIEFKAIPIAEIQSIIDQSRASEDSSEQINLLTSVLPLLKPLTTRKLYAIPPLNALFNELYIHHLSKESYLEALTILLFISLHLDPYTYQAVNHPIRVVRLSTIATLLKHVSSLPTETILPPTSTPFTESQREVIRNVDYISAMHVMLILAWELGTKSHGAESRFVKELKAELDEVDDVQRLRGDGKVGFELRRWMVMGDVAVEGKLLAETVLGHLKDLAGFVGSVVKKIEV